MIKRLGRFAFGFCMLAAITALTSCQRNSPMPPDSPPADFSLTYDFAAETVPPPWHQEYTITIDTAGAGTIVYLPDYPGPDVPKWTETFTVSPDSMKKIWREAQASGLLDGRMQARSGSGPVGGPSQSLILRCNGKDFSVPSSLANPDQAAMLYDAVIGSVPKETWAKLEQGRESYQEEFERRRAGR
jgi:hypothetical protein